MAMVFLAMIFGLIYAAILTAEPSSKANKSCLLGYKAHCSFTPISTVLCIFAAIITASLQEKYLQGDAHER